MLACVRFSFGPVLPPHRKYRVAVSITTTRSAVAPAAAAAVGNNTSLQEEFEVVNKEDTPEINLAEASGTESGYVIKKLNDFFDIRKLYPDKNKENNKALLTEFFKQLANDLPRSDIFLSNSNSFKDISKIHFAQNIEQSEILRVYARKLNQYYKEEKLVVLKSQHYQ